MQDTLNNIHKIDNGRQWVSHKRRALNLSAVKGDGDGSYKVKKGSEYGCIRVLDQNQVAEMLCVSPKTLEYWRWKKKGPKSFKIGRLVRYRESDIFDYVMELVGEEVPELNNI